MKSESPQVDSYKDTKASFFRQSGWMMAANMICGVFMAGAAFLAANFLTPKSDYAIFATVLRVFVLTSIPAAAMQTLLAQQIAAAVTEESRRTVAAAVRGVLKITFGIWIFLLVVAVINRVLVLKWLQTTDINVLWAMMFLILASMLWPLFLGILQGKQKFFAFGWSTILNGIGRFGTILLGVKLWSIGAKGAVYAALAGFGAAVLVAVFPARSLFYVAKAQFDWASFFKRTGLLCAASGSVLFLTNVDMLFILGFFPTEVSSFYATTETIGISVVTLCVPVAAVMFPKIVRSRATQSNSDALKLALTGTVIIASGSAIFCSIWPELPYRILAPQYVDAAPLLPWFLWAMVPVTLYNVLINNLIARERWAIIPWCAILPIAYAITVYLFLERTHLPPFAAFKRVIQILMGYSTTLMLISVYYSRRAAAAESSSRLPT